MRPTTIGGGTTRTMADPVPGWDSKVALWVGDANDTAYPLVPLEDVPTDGTHRLPTEPAAEHDGQQHSVIEAAFDAAVAFVPLPTIPRRPERIPFPLAVRSGSYWSLVRTAGSPPIVRRIKTKQAAEELAEAMVMNIEIAADEWEVKYYGLVTTGVEGVDWRWER